MLNLLIGRRYTAAFPTLMLLANLLIIILPASASACEGETVDSNGNVLTSTDAECRTTKYEYDGQNRQIAVTQAFGTADEFRTDITRAPTTGNVIAIVDPNLRREYTYDADGNLIEKKETDQTTHTNPYPTNGQTRIWKYTYNSDFRITSEDGPLPGSDDTVYYSYDSDGNMNVITDEIGNSTEILSFVDGSPTSIKENSGLIKTLEYDDNHRLVRIISNPSGPSSTVEINYNNESLISKISYPDAFFLEFEYNSLGDITKITDPLDQSVTYTYDAFGNNTSETYKDSSSETYFKRQRLYNDLYLISQVIRSGDTLWNIGYDEVGNKTSQTDPAGRIRTFQYDNLDRLISETSEGGDTRTWSYGTFSEAASTTDPRGIATSYVRNGWGEVIQETSGDIGTVVYQRDQRGLVTKVTDANGKVTDYQYDLLGRSTTVAYPTQPSINVTFSYDSTAGGNAGVGKLTGVSDSAGAIQWRYNVFGEITEESRTIDSQSYSIGYERDAYGQIVKLVYPSGREVEFGRGLDGNIENVHTRSDANAPTVGLAWWVTHTPMGPMQGLLHGNELTDWRTFDEDARVVTQVLTDETTTPHTELVKRLYHYADDRNLTAIENQIDPTKTENYWYAWDNQIQNAYGPWGDITIFVDGVGNITHNILEYGGVTTTSVLSYANSSNRLSQITTNGVTDRVFATDSAGNITTDVKQATARTLTLAYNDAGKLVTATDNGSIVGQYKYDYLARLTVRTVSGGTQAFHYLYDLDGNLIAEYDGAGNVVREYVWLDARPLAVVVYSGASEGEIFHIHTDHLERPVLMTDVSKSPVWQATYLPFGGMHTVIGSANLDLRFPGQRFQSETGLHYNWHRHYDPTTGRYLQPDPLGMPDGPSRWSYALNSPLMKVDPTGLDLADDILNWLGPGSLCIPSPNGATQFMSADRSRIIRFDITPRTSHGMGPHINIEPGRKHIMLCVPH